MSPWEGLAQRRAHRLYTEMGTIYTEMGTTGHAERVARKLAKIRAS